MAIPKELRCSISSIYSGNSQPFITPALWYPILLASIDTCIICTHSHPEMYMYKQFKRKVNILIKYSCVIDKVRLSLPRSLSFTLKKKKYFFTVYLLRKSKNLQYESIHNVNSKNNFMKQLVLPLPCFCLKRFQYSRPCPCLFSEWKQRKRITPFSKVNLYPLEEFLAPAWWSHFQTRWWTKGHLLCIIQRVCVLEKESPRFCFQLHPSEHWV